MSISRPSALSRDAAGRKPGHEVLPRQHRAIGLQARGTGQIASGVDWLRGVVVVATKDESTGNVEQRLKRFDNFADRIPMREKVTGGDHGIGAKFQQAGHPRLLCGLSRDQVQIRQMQYAQIRLWCGEGANGGATQGEALGLPAGVCHGS